jgi:hypothetical protein
VLEARAAASQDTHIVGAEGRLGLGLGLGLGEGEGEGEGEGWVRGDVYSELSCWHEQKVKHQRKPNMKASKLATLEDRYL